MQQPPQSNCQSLSKSNIFVALFPKCRPVARVSAALSCSMRESCGSIVREVKLQIGCKFPDCFYACDRPRLQSSVVRQYLYSVVPSMQDIVPWQCPIGVSRRAHNHAHQSTIFHVQFCEIMCDAPKQATGDSTSSKYRSLCKMDTPLSHNIHVFA